MLLTFFRRLLSTDFMPHIFCLRQDVAVIQLFVWSNAAIALAYYLIPLSLVNIVRKRKDLVFNWMFVLFGIFILACGTTHVLDIWTLWHPMYRLQVLIEALTALASLGTALLLIRLTPQIMQIPSPALLLGEISNRKAAELEVRELNAQLDGRVRDRTAALERSNHQLNFANTRLLSINEGLQQFAFAASHDLQEPLRMLSVYSQLVQRNCQGKLDQRTDEQLTIIAENAKRMQALLTDLLDYSRLMGDEGFVTPACAEPNGVVNKVLGSLAREIEISQANIKCERLPCVYTSEVHLTQLFQNLISNAIKYRGLQPLQIAISAELEGGVCRFAVEDNGIGIDSAYHEQIFGLFKRLHGKNVSGTGIGLAICQKIVERYSGRIWVESEDGCGSKFYFELPVEPREVLRTASPMSNLTLP